MTHRSCQPPTLRLPWIMVGGIGQTPARVVKVRIEVEKTGAPGVLRSRRSTQRAGGQRQDALSLSTQSEPKRPSVSTRVPVAPVNSNGTRVMEKVPSIFPEKLSRSAGFPVAAV